MHFDMDINDKSKKLTSVITQLLFSKLAKLQRDGKTTELNIFMSNLRSLYVPSNVIMLFSFSRFPNML